MDFWHINLHNFCYYLYSDKGFINNIDLVDFVVLLVYVFDGDVLFYIKFGIFSLIFVFSFHDNYEHNK